MIKLFACFLPILILSACSSNKQAGVVYHDSFDFNAVKRYSLYDHNSDFSDTQSLLDARRNAIEIAIEQTMAKYKFSYSAVAVADVIVTYHMFDGKAGDYSKYNEVVHFCTYCLRASTWKTDRQYSTVSQGSLVLDLVDPNKKRSIWRSVYPLNLKEKDNSAEVNEKIKQAVAMMLAQYPKENTLGKQAN